MEFAERLATARRMLVDYLDQFTPPRGLDDQQMANRISSVADAFARKMPTKGDFQDAVAQVLTKVSDTHLSNTWPPQAAFVLAMPAGDAIGRPAAESFIPADRGEWYSDLMRDGENVPEAVLWGPLASKLPPKPLERYRSASVMAWVETYREDAQKMMTSRYGSTVLAYFPDKEESA